METTRHFTASIFIVHKDKVLLHMHKRHQCWLQVGGHFDRDELPHEAALREAKEESGFDVKIYHQGELIKFKDVQELIQPAHLLLEDINPYHQHIDFIYFGTSASDQIDPLAEEAHSLTWFTEEELNSLEKIPDDVKFLAKKALEILGTK